MAYIPYNKLWESEFDNIISKRTKLQDLNFNHLKLEVRDTCKKDEKIITVFELTDNSDAINKAYLDEKLLKINRHTYHYYNKITTNLYYNTTNNL